MERIIRALVKEHAKEIQLAVHDFNNANIHLLLSNKPEDISQYLVNVMDKINKMINDLIIG